MKYPEQLTAALLLEHEGHALTVHRHGRHGFPAGFDTAAASIECQTCAEGVALEWTDSQAESMTKQERKQ